jgi:hypothetical protein
MGPGDTFSGVHGANHGGCGSNIAEIFQPLLDNALLRLIHLSGGVADKILQHVLEKPFQALKLPTVPLFRGTAEFLRKLHPASVFGHVALTSARRNVPLIRAQTVLAISWSSASRPQARAMAMKARYPSSRADPIAAQSC